MSLMLKNMRVIVPLKILKVTMVMIICDELLHGNALKCENFLVIAVSHG